MLKKLILKMYLQILKMYFTRFLETYLQVLKSIEEIDIDSVDVGVEDMTVQGCMRK